MAEISKIDRLRNITPSALVFGFIGLGNMGSEIVRNLLESGHKVVVWNRTRSKCREFRAAGAKVVATPRDVVNKVDIIFSCVSDPMAAKEIVYGGKGILSAISSGKGYVAMTGMDVKTSQDIAEAITSKGGRYLEALLQGSKRLAADGKLIVLSAGNRNLMMECQSCFEAMCATSFYLGDVGEASKMYSVLQLISGITVAGLAEGFALAERAGLKVKDVLDVMETTIMSSTLLMEQGTAIVSRDYAAQHAVRQRLQTDLRMALALSDSVMLPVPLTSAAKVAYEYYMPSDH